MKSHPSVSVIVPAFRQAEHVVGCLDSIAAQTYPGPIEVVVVDDGCPEGTGDVAAAHPLAPRVVRQVNAGVAMARNRGIDEAKGQYLAFLDADDRWLATKLETQLAAHRSVDHPALSLTRYHRVRLDGRPMSNALHPSPTQAPTARALVRQNFIGCSTVVAHRACVERVGGFPNSEALRRAGQDYALWLRIAAYFPLLYVPEVLTEYTVHDDNRVGTDAVKHFEGWRYAVQSFAEWDDARFRAIAGASLRMLIHRRARRMFFDVATQPSKLRRAWSAYRAALR